jgi:hypothetical protein
MLVSNAFHHSHCPIFADPSGQPEGRLHRAGQQHQHLLLHDRRLVFQLCVLHHLYQVAQFEALPAHRTRARNAHSHRAKGPSVVPMMQGRAMR